MFTQKVGTVSLWAGTRALANYSRRAPLDPGRLSNLDAIARAAVQRTAVVSAVARKIETGFSPKLVAKIEPGILADAFAEAGTVARRLDNGRTLSQVVKASTPGIQNAALLRVCMSKSSAATKAFEKIQAVLTGDDLEALSKSQNADVVAAVAEHANTSYSTLADMIISNQSVSDPLQMRIASTALNAFLGRRKSLLGPVQISALGCHNNPSVVEAHNLLYGEMDVARLKELTLLEGNIAKKAFERLEHMVGVVDDEFVLSLAASANPNVFEKASARVAEKVVNDPQSGPRDIAIAISRYYRVMSEKLGASFRARVFRDREGYLRSKGACVARIADWIKSKADDDMRKQIIDALYYPQLGNELRVLVGRDLDRLIEMAMRSDYLAKNAAAHMIEEALLTDDVARALSGFVESGEVKELEALLSDINTPKAVFEQIALMNNAIALQAYARLKNADGGVSEKALATLSKSASKDILEKVICDPKASSSVVSEALTQYCQIMTAEQAQMSKRKPTKQEKAELSQRRREDVARIVGWIQLRGDIDTQNAISLGLTRIDTRMYIAIRDKIVGRQK